MEASNLFSYAKNEETSQTLGFCFLEQSLDQAWAALISNHNKVMFLVVFTAAAI